jgi:hypothetical protein
LIGSWPADLRFSGRRDSRFFKKNYVLFIKLMQKNVLFLKNQEGPFKDEGRGRKLQREARLFDEFNDSIGGSIFTS